MSKPESHLTDEDRERWLLPFTAVKILIEAGLDDREHAVKWLLARLKCGELLAVANIVQLSKDMSITGYKVGLLSTRVWRDAHKIHWKDDFWVSGDYSSTEEEDTILSNFHIAFEVGLNGVRFDPAPILQFAARAAAPENAKPPSATKPEPATPARRGAKRKDWWDHLWIEMIRRIRAGTLKAAKPADLQIILEDYVRDELGYEAGDSTLKPMASNLFKYLEEISGDIGGN